MDNCKNFINHSESVNQSLNERKFAEDKSNRSFILISLVTALLMIFIIFLNTNVFFVALVDGSSMEPTMYTGNKLVANRYKGVEKGSVVCIEVKDGDEIKLIIKRIIAKEGQTIEIKGGYVYVDGQQLDESFIKEQGKTFYDNADKNKNYKYTLKENEIFYLGDNRSVSKDARYYGACQVRQIIGVVEEWSLWLNGLFI